MNVAGLAIAGVLAWSAVASATVTMIDATVQAEVQEVPASGPGDSDLAFEDLNETATNLPLEAAALLGGTDSGDTTGGASATTRFFDPRLSLDADPDEFQLSVVAVSPSEGSTYVAEADATEQREVTFLAEELAREDGTPLAVRSQFFLDGFVLIWSDPGVTDLSETLAAVELSVGRIRPHGAAGPKSLLDARIELTGTSDGGVSLAASGAIAEENVVLLDLTGDSEEFGALHLLIIPASTALAYDYDADVGEDFQLEATISANGTSAPGTGVAVQLGVPPLALAQSITSLIGALIGDALGNLVDDALSAAPAPAKVLRATQEGTVIVVGASGGDSPVSRLLPISCAPLGLEVAVLGLGLAMTGFRRRVCFRFRRMD
jgi:hypothetical protein